MRSSIFKPLDPIFVFAFLYNFKAGYDSSRIHEGAAIWLFSHFTKQSIKTSLSYRMWAAENNETN